MNDLLPTTQKVRKAGDALTSTTGVRMTLGTLIAAASMIGWWGWSMHDDAIRTQQKVSSMLQAEQARQEERQRALEREAVLAREAIQAQLARIQTQLAEIRASLMEGDK